mgnify:CR=1 FL=1
MHTNDYDKQSENSKSKLLRNITLEQLMLLRCKSNELPKVLLRFLESVAGLCIQNNLAHVVYHNIS